MLTGLWAGMTLENLLTFVGLVFVGLQMRNSNQQLKRQSQIQLYDINRELISLGLSKPALFEVLEDAPDVDPTIERRYLQLWLNQLCLVESFKRSGTFAKDVGESFEVDLCDMMRMKNMRRHWQRFGKYYPASFRTFVENILHEAGREQTSAPGQEPSSLSKNTVVEWRREGRIGVLLGSEC